MHNLCHKCCTLHVHMLHVHADVHIWLVGILQCYNLLVLNSHQLVADWTRELHHEYSLVRQNCLHSVKQPWANEFFHKDSALCDQENLGTLSTGATALI